VTRRELRFGGFLCSE